LEKFTYAVFYDTAPTIFSFAFFFFFSGYLCLRKTKTAGRFADLAPFLVLAPLLFLLALSLAEADFTNLLPVFNYGFGRTVYAFKRTLPHFSDALLLLPLLAEVDYKKGDGKKILLSYGAGAVLTLLFLACFFGVFSSVAPQEHYAFAKIAQYFPALTVVGRVDLIFAYILCVPLFFCTAFPLSFAVDTATKLLGERSRLTLAIALNLGAFLFTLFCNRFYDSIYLWISDKLFFVFLLALAPVCLCFALGRKNR
jgi:hypothetical protein